MLKFFKSRLLKSERPVEPEVSLKFLLVEVLIFILIILSAGYIINKDDILFMESKHSIAIHIIPLVVLTLFYGFIGGSIYIIAFYAVNFSLYKKLDPTHTMYMTLLLMILAEFQLYWDKLIRYHKERFEYTNYRLRNVARSYYITKLSHDRLESYNIVKPLSIRGFLEDLQKDMLKGISIKESLTQAIILLSNIYFIEKAGLFEFVNSKFELLHGLGGMESLDMDDPLVREAMEREGEAVYVSMEDLEDSSKYLCFIPLYKENKLKYAFVIERMPFMNLNVDNVFSINLVLQHVILEYEDSEPLRELVGSFPEFEIGFIRELYQMEYMRKKYKIKSTVVLFVLKVWDESLFYLVRDKVRGLDVVSKYEDKALLVLLPLTDTAGAYAFVRRMDEVIKGQRGADLVKLGIFYHSLDVKEAEETLLRIRKALKHYTSIINEDLQQTLRTNLTKV